MPKPFTLHKQLAMLTLIFFAITACQGSPTPNVPKNIETTPAEAETSSPTPSATTNTGITPTAAEPSSPRTLTYCWGDDPGSLYLYGADIHTAVRSLVLEAIYDGPIDTRSFDYQPVILAKLPNLAEDDAQLKPVPVSRGQTVVDADGVPVALEPGVHVHPSGCQSEACSVTYDGSPGLEMDQLSATFELLPDLKWSDGEPLTAADSVYSFKLAVDPDTTDPLENGRKSTIQHTASYTALDELRVEWVGLPGYLDATYSTNFWSPLPEHLWGNLSAAELLTADVSTQMPVGWGPYAITNRVPGESLTFEKNEYYFRAGEGLPHFDRLVMRFVGDDFNANLAMLLAGECDLAGALRTSLPEQADRLVELSASGQINLVSTTGSLWEHLDFGIQPQSYDDGWQPGDRPDFFGDVRTRRAFTMCMDRQRMAAAAQDQQFVADSFVSPLHPLYNPDVRHYDFDPAAGSALLAEVGWQLGPDGVRVYAGVNPRIPSGTRFMVHLDARHNQRAAQVMVDSLARCGIQLSTTFWDGNELFADGPEGVVFGRNFELAEFRWVTGSAAPCDLYLSEQIPGEDLSRFPLGWEGSNDPGFSDPEYDQACRAALHSLPGQPGYVENNLKAQQIFAEQLPVVPLYFNTALAFTRPDFCGQILDPTEGDTWNIESFDYGPGC
jgi:peptide/nickel transport system substrate-binding protein